jgi:RNA polymerase sigma factor (sigma-70 family)
VVTQNSTIVRANDAIHASCSMVEVFTAHRAQLTATAYQHTRSWNDAEDIVQAVWMRWAAQYQKVSAPASWLHRVTTNAAIDHLRHAGRRFEVYGVCLDRLSGPGIDPQPTVEAREQIEVGVKILLESLSALERAVFVCRRVGRWSHGETAAALSRTPAAVRQVDHRARARFTENPKRFAVADPTVRRVARQLLLATSVGEPEWMIRIVWLELPRCR